MRKLTLLYVVVAAASQLVNVAHAAPLPNLVLACPDSAAIGLSGLDSCRGYVYQVPTNERIVFSGSEWRRMGNLLPSELVLVCALPVEPGQYSSCRDASGVRRLQFVPKSTILTEPPPPSGGARIIDLSSPPLVITESGVYVFNRSWTGVEDVGGPPPNAAIVIQADDVILDLQGFELSSAGNAITSNVDNVTIRDGRVSTSHGIAISASGDFTRIERVRVGVDATGIGIRLSGRGSALTDSSIGMGTDGLGLDAGDDITVRANRISSGEAGIRAASRTRIVDNRLSCNSRAPCIEVEGADNIVSNNEFTTFATLVIRGNDNHVLDNIFQRNCPGAGSATFDTALLVAGRGNTIRETLIPGCDGHPGWLTGIAFLQDGNFYGDNTVWATVPFDLGATVQTDLGGNVGIAQ